MLVLPLARASVATRPIRPGHWVRRASWRHPANRTRGANQASGGLGYLAGTDPKDPLVAPINSPEIMAKFPPTLIITATRGFEMSGALYTHAQLVKLGVDAELHVWEALFHGFFYNPDVPESRDCYDVIVKFFDRHLGPTS